MAGILVLRIEGDDDKNSLQRDLVSTLNTELSKEAPGQKIEVRAHNETVAETKGLSQAHAKARQIGKDCNALLVIWGNKVDENKFHPRLTLVERTPPAIKFQDLSLSVQSIAELRLPEELIKKPLYLTHFIVGYNLHDKGNYTAALVHFEAALNRPETDPVALNDIRLYAANSHWYLAQSQNEMAWHLLQAIAYYETARRFYTAQDFPERWATTQNNLGSAYWSLPTGSRSDNLQKAITAYEAALRVYTEKAFPVEWAATQNNLGIIYTDLPTDERGTNLKKAIAAYKMSLRVYTEKNFPKEWAMTENNLGTAYAELPIGDRTENLQKAIAAFEAAFRIRTEKDFPVDWAQPQNNWGKAYVDLPTGDRTENLQKAIAAYELALRVYTEKDFPMEWARIQENLGEVYSDLPTGDRTENLEKAIACYENALKILRAKPSSDHNLKVAKNIKNAQTQLQNLAKN